MIDKDRLAARERGLSSVVPFPSIAALHEGTHGLRPSGSRNASELPHGDGAAPRDVRRDDPVAESPTCEPGPVDFACDPLRRGAAAAAVVVRYTKNASVERRGIVRERLNAAVRPILRAFVRRRGIRLEDVQDAIDGPTPLADPSVVRHLGGALHSEAMRCAIASTADPTLLPLEVRAGLARMRAQSLSDPPPAAVRQAFPDWSKSVVPLGQRMRQWRAEDAAVWLGQFPLRGLLHPLDTWDAATTAIRLNDREPASWPEQEGAARSTVVAFGPADLWKPSLEVLHTLEELELEALTDRVFRELMRRDVMPSHVNERRVRIGTVIEHVTFGYLGIEEARQSIRAHDLRRTERFERLFGTDQEWIHDLCGRIIAAYEWPPGFAESELWTDFPDLDDDTG
ncbi:hypothetical protein [uncultured Methylobacterium sp.]|uniref:hypothetical protein n=1 Tax=uncultured Methylobacterium sp. TaxID=157278 RepID=UPI002595287B|nr:hypothetical protein [uncultured Methylobacterium sp.]